jgi:beta-galactosidase
MNHISFFGTAGLWLTAGCLAASSVGVREISPLRQWQFCSDQTPDGGDPVLPNEQTSWAPAILPHVFRLAGLYEHSAGWYRIPLDVSKADEGKRFYLYLEGAGSTAQVFVNGVSVGSHRGAFTAAAFDLTPALRFGEKNDLLVRATNRLTEAANCLSHSNLYYTNGGLYRPAWLWKTSAVHIFPDMGSTGVYLSPKDITAERATLSVQTVLRNGSSKTAEARVRHTVTDPHGALCAVFETSARILAGETQSVTAETQIENPKLWDIGQPNLYTVVIEVLEGNVLVDAITERTGFRRIEMKDGCFVLNGRELISRGVCKHHQSEQTWNAMSDEQLQQEWDAMINLGVNTVRLAHYPHRRFEYSLADEHGVAIWAENGLAGQKWDPKDVKDNKWETAFHADGERITREMVRQNWNHPSILFWSSGNETYQEVASHYADIIRQEDKTRLITYASAGEKPANVDFVAGNTYQGWYYGHYTDFQKLPENAFISETGSGSWTTHHVPYGTMRWDVDKFEPEEYNELFAEFRFETIFRTNPSGHKMFLWWNFREFYNKKFKGNRNTKGILTLAGMPKDYYYLFRSFLRPDDPVLHLCGRHHFYRQFEPANGIKAYSNAPEAELFINGLSQGVRKNGEYVQPDSTIKEGNQSRTVPGTVIHNVFFWKAPLAPGKNTVEVRDRRGLAQTMVIYQKDPLGPMPQEPDSLVADVQSSNPENPAFWIDRPVENQGPFYYQVNGQSDNTFDILPAETVGATWIATGRLSEMKNKTDLSFRVSRPATVYVLYSTGTFPAHTLKKPDLPTAAAAADLIAALRADGFTDTGTKGLWRGQDLWLADCGLLSRQVQPGQTVRILGRTLDYAVLIKPSR